MGTKKTIILACLVLLVALGVRLYSLDTTAINADEPRWQGRICEFYDALARGDLVATQVTSHPGVTTMWLGGLGKLLAGFPPGDFSNGEQLFWTIHKATVIPLAIVNSLVVLVLFLLLRKVWGEGEAFAAAVFLGLDPFHIAHSRVLHLDALLSSFMLLSAVALLVFVKKKNYWYMVLSGVFASLALLTKQTALYLVPFTFLVLGLEWVFHHRKFDYLWSHFAKPLFLWGVVIGLSYALFNPAFWGNPVHALRNIYDYFKTDIYRSITTSHPGTAYYLGEVQPNEGVFYYPLVLLFKSTPFSFIFGTVGIFLTVRNILRKRIGADFYIFCYFLFFTLQMTMAFKNGDRYFLPALVSFDLLAGYALVKYLKNITMIFAGKFKRFWAYGFVFLVLLFAHVFMYKQAGFHYLAMYNPLFGGASTAKKFIKLGWGEGLGEAARYLNSKPNAENLGVISFYDSAFALAFIGNTYEFDAASLPVSDYFVFYIGQVQRHRDSQYLEKFFDPARAEYTVKLNGVSYVWVIKE
ncbi:MAG: ArnT family glycosyltransferase [Patescibacteria group bacterium]